MPSFHRLSRSLSAAAPLARLRTFFLALAVLAAVGVVPELLVADRPLGERLAATAAALGLAAYWAIGHRRGRFPSSLELPEAAAVLLVLWVAPGNPLLPLGGLLFRSLYGSSPLSLLRYGLWVAALLGAHASRGTVELHGDISRSIGLAAVPLVLPALRAALERLEASERRLASLVQNSSDIVTVLNSDLSVRWQAQSIRSELGHEPREVLGTNIIALVHPEDRVILQEYARAASRDESLVSTLVLRLRHADGNYRHLDVVASNRLADRSVRGFVLNMRDATERRRLEEDLRTLASQREHEAQHDPLTGLPNRRKLFQDLAAALEHADAAGVPLAVLMLDLDGFKEINDTLGHHAGDALLGEIPQRLLAACPDAKLIARFGGDEFAIVLRPGVDAAQARCTAAELVAAINEPFAFQGLTLLVRVSVGIAVFPEHASDVTMLLRRADIAMYAAKRSHLRLESYNASADAYSRERLSMIGQLPHAISEGEMVVYYQPKFDLHTARVTGVEALVRWQHPTLGLLGPGAFVPLAEEAGLMRALTLHVLQEALAQTARWSQQGLTVPVAVNLAAANLLDVALPTDVSTLLARYGVPPSQLVLEVTETMIGADPLRILDVLEHLGDLGITLSLDDFGTGSSSLSFLRQLPVHEVKIDRSFVGQIATDEQDAAIVRAIIDLGHNLGMTVVAEGIETDEVYDRLAELGCDEAQGFLMGRPVPADEFEARAFIRAAVPLPPRAA
jgi:diguanylate cyclase (GGDEF)-like protein/PAS domain S-box-containing protein